MDDSPKRAQWKPLELAAFGDAICIKHVTSDFGGTRRKPEVSQVN